jgi:hypothetical protein
MKYYVDIGTGTGTSTSTGTGTGTHIHYSGNIFQHIHPEDEYEDL